MLSLTHDKLEHAKSQLSSSVVQPADFVREERENEGIYPELVTRMENLSSKLMEQRKNLKPQANYPKSEDFSRI